MSIEHNSNRIQMTPFIKGTPRIASKLLHFFKHWKICALTVKVEVFTIFSLELFQSGFKRLIQE